jgi:protein-disulfide isomerase
MRALKTILVLAAVTVAAAATGYLVRSDSSRDAQQQIALINGRPLYVSDLPADVQGEIRQLQQQAYQAQFQGVREVALERMLKEEAQRRGISVEELVRQEADAKVPDPGEAELKALADAQKSGAAASDEKLIADLRNRLRKPRVDAARQAYFLQLLDAAKIEFLLEAPRTEVATDPLRLRGNPSAPVRIVEFSEFQCPYCRRAQPTVKAVLEKYGDQISHAFRDFPLRDIHAGAQKAAEASRCAAEQGRFWEYHKLLYDNFGKLSREDLGAHAATLQLAQPQFDSCLDSGKYADAVEKDLQEGLRAGVNGTPGFFINGIFLNGAQPQSAFERIIETELARRKK